MGKFQGEFELMAASRSGVMAVYASAERSFGRRR
jgi:hypothetical protein